MIWIGVFVPLISSCIYNLFSDWSPHWLSCSYSLCVKLSPSRGPCLSDGQNPHNIHRYMSICVCKHLLVCVKGVCVCVGVCAHPDRSQHMWHLQESSPRRVAMVKCLPWTWRGGFVSSRRLGALVRVTCELSDSMVVSREVSPKVQQFIMTCADWLRDEIEVCQSPLTPRPWLWLMATLPDRVLITTQSARRASQSQPAR